MHKDFDLHISLEACSSIYPIYNPHCPRNHLKKSKSNIESEFESEFKSEFKSELPKSKSNWKPKSKSVRNRLIHNIFDYCCSCFRE